MSLLSRWLVGVCVLWGKGGPYPPRGWVRWFGKEPGSDKSQVGFEKVKNRAWTTGLWLKGKMEEQKRSLWPFLISGLEHPWVLLLVLSNRHVDSGRGVCGEGALWIFHLVSKFRGSSWEDASRGTSTCRTDTEQVWKHLPGGGGWSSLRTRGTQSVEWQSYQILTTRKPRQNIQHCGSVTGASSMWLCVWGSVRAACGVFACVCMCVHGSVRVCGVCENLETAKCSLFPCSKMHLSLIKMECYP